MQYYSDPYKYIESCTEIAAKITAIDQIIEQLLLSAVKAAAGENITQYTLNDGQTIISTTKRSSASIEQSISAFQKLRNYYMNKATGRVFRLVDVKNLNGRGC